MNRLIIQWFFTLALSLSSSAAFGQTEPTHRPSLSDITSLRKKLTLPLGEVRYGKIFRLLTQRTGIKIGSDNAELLQTKAVIACEDVAAASLMDAIAALNGSEWRAEGGVIRLYPGRGYLDRTFQPVNDQDEERLKIGLKFLAGIDALPAGLRKSLFAPEGLKVVDMPSDLQRNFHDMLERTAIEHKMNQSILAPESLPQFVVSLKNDSYEDEPRVRGVFVYFSAPDGTRGGWRIHDYETASVKSDTAVNNNPSRQAYSEGVTSTKTTEVTRYPAIKFALSQEQALTLPRWRRPASLNVTNALLWQAAATLAQTYHFPVITDPKFTLRQKASFSVQQKPLIVVIDELTKTYKETEWEIRDAGFLVLRGPSSPTRDPKKGNGSRRKQEVIPPQKP